MENSEADDQLDTEILQRLADAIDARDRASLLILNTLRALKAKRWFTRWCEEHGITPEQMTRTTKTAKSIRAVLEQNRTRHTHAARGTRLKLVQ